MGRFEPDSERPEKRATVYLTEHQLEQITEVLYDRIVHRLEQEFGHFAVRAILWVLGAGGAALLVAKGFVEVMRK